MSNFNEICEKIYVHKIEKLAKLIETNNLDPHELLCYSVKKLYPLMEFKDPWRDQINKGYKSDNDAWQQQFDKYLASKSQKPAPAAQPVNRDELSKVLGDTIKGLMHLGLTSNNIEQLVDQAIKDAQGPIYVGAKAPQSAYSTHNIGYSAPSSQYIAGITPDDVKGMKSQSVTTHSPEAEFENPSWYKDMTNAEKKWFDNLNINQKNQFVTKHNNMGFDKTIAGNKALQPGTEDHALAQKVANEMKRRNPQLDYHDDESVFKAAAGLVNRQKIRKELQKDLDDWGEDLMPNFDDLLYKDHYSFNKWHKLSGIKE